MPTIPEDVRRKIEADLLAEMGMHPGSATLQIDENGQPSLVPTGATDRGAGRAFFHAAGHRAAQGVATVPAGIAAASAAGPIIHPAAAGASAALTPAAGAAVELLGNAGAFTAGQMAAQAALDKSGGSDWILKQFGDTRDQVTLDRAAHPVATAGGDFLGSLATFQFNNPLKMGRNVSTLVRALMSGTAVPAAAKAGVQSLANNVLGNVGVTTAMQLGQDGELHPGELARAAVEGALLGKPRAGVQALGRAASQPAHRLFGAPLAEPGGPLFTQKAAPASSPAEGGAPATTAEPPRPVRGLLPERNPILPPTPAESAEPSLAEWAARGRVPDAVRNRSVDGAPVEPTTAPQPTLAPGEKYYGDAPDVFEGARPGPTPTQPATPVIPPTAPPTLQEFVQSRAKSMRAKQFSIPAHLRNNPKTPQFLESAQSGQLSEHPEDADAINQLYGQLLTEYKASQAIKKARSFRPAADAPTPEPAPVLAEAVRAAADPATTKAAALIPEGSPAVAAPTGMKLVRVPQGVLLVNPAKVPPGEPVLTPDGQVRGTLLGLSQESKPAQPGAAVVTDRPGAPAVLTEVTDGTPAANAAAAEAQRRAVPDGRQRVTTPDEVVATRAAALRPATAPENSGPIQAPPPQGLNTQRGAEPQARTGAYPSERGGVNPAPAAQAPAEAGAGAPKLHPVLEAIVQREQGAKPPAPAGLGDAAGFEPVPLSIVDRAHKMSPATGKALADYHSATQAIYGRHFNVLLDQLRAFPREVVNSAIGKRLNAYKTKRPPSFTPDEARINDMYDRVMKASAAEATAAGYPIKPEDWYVPQIFNETVARRYETEGAAFLAREMPKFHAHNATIDPTYNPAEGEKYAADYLAGVARSPNSLGSDFGALTKYKRQYHLSPEWLEPDFQRGLQRYGQRFAGQVAYKQFIEPNAEAMANLYGDRGNAVTPPMQNARAGVEGVLFNAGRGSSGLSQNAKDLLSAGQQTIYSGAMQTATGVANTVQKTALHLGMAAQTEGGFQNLVQATHKTATEWETQRAKAIQSGLVRPGHDPSIIVEDAGPTMATARTMRDVAQTARKYTGAEFLETMNRVHDFTVGEGLAEINLRLLAKGDQSAVRFINRFGAGVTQQMAHGEKVMRMARNYAEAMQSSYSMVGLPAPMLKGGVVGQLTRIQRFGWENMMRTHQYVLKPALYKGEYGPLLAYLFGAAVTAPVLAKIREAFSGRPSGIPTEEEIAAGKHPAAVEHILDIMQAAQLSGAFGLAGSTAGAVASNVRGGRQSIAGDPALAFGVSFINNAGHAAEAVRQGEPGALVLVELAKRVFVDNIQVLRRFGTDEGEAQDRRNKAVFEYLNDQRDIPIGDMVNNLVFGGITPGRTPQISPTKEAARAGDRAALQRLTPEQRTALDNYPGGYEDADKEAKYQQWLRQTQPPETLADYQRRRAAWKSRPAASRP